MLNYGETSARQLSMAIHNPVADETELAALSSREFAHLETIRVGAATWYFDASSSASGSAGSVVVPVDNPATGRFKVDAPLGAAAGSVPLSRTITATAPITIAGTTSATLAADRTIAISAATPSLPGSMSAADKTKLDAVQMFNVTLDGGTATKSTGITVTSSTRVVGIVATVRGGTFPAGGFESLTAGNVVGAPGTGAVTITARKADGTLEDACTDTVSVLLAG